MLKAAHKAIVFNMDLDNTLIYSYKHEIGPDKVCIEIYQGREISYITAHTLELLKRVSEKALVVPTTTRTVEQYRRISIGVCHFSHVLACNGGVLLVDGEEDARWYQESRSLVQKSKREMEKAQDLMESDSNRNFELRDIRELFLFTKSRQPEKTISYLKGKLDLSLVDVFCNGVKVYVVPKGLDKGTGVRRLREKLKAEAVIAAGDSAFDIPMLEYADYAIAPADLPFLPKKGGVPIQIGKEEIFSEKVLEQVLEITEDIYK